MILQAGNLQAGWIDAVGSGRDPFLQLPVNRNRPFGQQDESRMTEITHRTIETNGIRMHVAEKGAGPLVVLCHGFPESWYSWRHQIDALAEAGFHVVAPDMRGYGQTDHPEAIDSYTLLHLVGDMVGLLDTLGAPTAVIAGHDWGAPVAWHAALLRPDRFRAIIGLSVPFRPRGSVRPTTIMPQTDDAVFYQLYFQTPGVAEAELEQNVRLSIRRVLLANAGDKPPISAGEAAANTVADATATCTTGGVAADSVGRAAADGVGRAGADGVGMVPRVGGLSHSRMATVPSAPLPAWLTEADLDFYVGEFTHTGFRGGLNWYRNIDRNWELLAPFDGARVTVPALYIAGDRDLVLAFRGMTELLPALPRLVPQLRQTIILPGCGHWTQQERPREVNAAMVDFLQHL